MVHQAGLWYMPHPYLRWIARRKNWVCVVAVTLLASALAHMLLGAGAAATSLPLEIEGSEDVSSRFPGAPQLQ